MIDVSKLKAEEWLALELKALYGSYGYSEYRSVGFEDYSLYAENKSFLDGSGVLTFNSGARLKALRPDVTLSVVKSVNTDDPEVVNKLYYDERVYRKTATNGEFSELRQIGVEVVGNVDEATEAEVCALIVKTLERVENTGKNCMIDVSHAGIIEKLVSGMRLSSYERSAAVECLKRKSVHDFDKLDIGDGKYKRAFRELIALPPDTEKALAALDGINDYVDLSDETDELKALLRYCGKHTELNFSIGGDADYYNGAVFKGYVEGVPYPVLSGGRYDKLLNRFGKSGRAFGFALYMGELAEYLSEDKPALDVAVAYDRSCYAQALEKAEKLRSEGKSVLIAPFLRNVHAKEAYKVGNDGNWERVVLEDRAQTIKTKSRRADGIINVALPKGRLGEKAFELFVAAGYGNGADISDIGRKLSFCDEKNGVNYFWVKPSDVAVYVERGAADAGIAGKDVLAEDEPDVYELLDLKIGKCKMCVAGLNGFSDDLSRPLRVASKFTRSAEKYYASVGRRINVIKLNGSVELAPVLGLSDVIFDIVETGGTLKANGLRVFTEVFDISARFVANKTAYKFKSEKLISMIRKINAAVNKQ